MVNGAHRVAVDLVKHCEGLIMTESEANCETVKSSRETRR